MRLCRFEQDGKAQAGFYFDKHIVPVAAAAKAAQGKTDRKLSLGNGDDLLPLLPHGKWHADAKRVAAYLEEHPELLEPGDDGVRVAAVAAAVLEHQTRQRTGPSRIGGSAGVGLSPWRASGWPWTS